MADSTTLLPSFAIPPSPPLLPSPSPPPFYPLLSFISQCDPKKVRLSEPRKEKLQLAPVAPPRTGSLDPTPYMAGGKTIKQAQLEYLQARLAGAHEDFLKAPKKKPGATYTKGQASKAKNRYGDVLPYDDTAVPLRQAADGSSYINANFVTFPTLSTKAGPYYFICSQGPTSTTVNDHWWVGSGA